MPSLALEPRPECGLRTPSELARAHCRNSHTALSTSKCQAASWSSSCRTIVAALATGDDECLNSYPTNTPPTMRGPSPIPAATIKSMRPSAFESPAAIRTPPRKFASSIPKNSAITQSKSPRRNTRTRGPPPSSGETMRSATPSPSMSPVATNNPPVKVGSKTSAEPDYGSGFAVVNHHARLRIGGWRNDHRWHHWRWNYDRWYNWRHDHGWQWRRNGDDECLTCGQPASVTV